MESKLITPKYFTGTYFGDMVAILDLGAGPQSQPLLLVGSIYENARSFDIPQVNIKHCSGKLIGSTVLYDDNFALIYDSLM